MSTNTGVRLKDSCKDSLISLSAAEKYITCCINVSIISFGSKEKIWKLLKFLLKRINYICISNDQREIDVYLNECINNLYE